MNLSPLPIQKFFSNIGLPLVGGRLFTYIAGTSTKVATYTNAGGTLNSNPIVLNFRGECRLWIDPQQSYKFVLAPPGFDDPPTNPIWTVDDITAAPLAFDNASVATGSVNNVSLSIPQISSPVAFTRVVFKAANTNTGPTTLQINGGTAADLVAQNRSDFSGGEIQEDGIYEAVFDGGAWQLLSPAIQPPQQRTASEVAAGTTPVNYYKFPAPWKDISRYVSDNSGATDVLAEMQAAFAAEKNIIIPEGTYLLNGTSGQLALQTRPGMRIEGATREGTTLLAGTSGMYILGYDGAHSNVYVANLLLNGNNLAARGYSSVSPSQGSSGNLILRNVRAALCSGPAIYIKLMTYADLCDIFASSSGEGLNLDTCFDSQVRGVSLFWDCTSSALSLSECSQIKILGARAFTNPSVTCPRIVYVNSSSTCGFYGVTFESQSSTPVGAELEVDRAGTRETVNLEVDGCEFIGTAATKDYCIKIGTSNTIYKPLFRNSRFFKPTTNASVLVTNASFAVFDGCSDIVSYTQTNYVPPSINQNNSSTIEVLDREYSGVPKAIKRYATANNQNVDLLQLTSEYAPSGTGTATAVGFGGGVSFGGRNPANIYREEYARISMSVQAGGFNGANLDFYTRRDAGVAAQLRGSWTYLGHYEPAQDNFSNLGSAALRWAVVYAATGAINTSDAMTKTGVATIDDVERRVAIKLKSMIRKFRMVDAVAKKGDGARIHFGIVAQDVASAFASEGLDPRRYALFCVDVWHEKEIDVNIGDEISRRVIAYPEPVDGSVEVTRLGVRYDELLAFIIGAL